jgi:hypothetical protein
MIQQRPTLSIYCDRKTLERVRQVARAHGFTNLRGSRTGHGSPNQIFEAIGKGDLALVRVEGIRHEMLREIAQEIEKTASETENDIEGVLLRKFARALEVAALSKLRLEQS